jgi:hypothetical protein
VASGDSPAIDSTEESYRTAGTLTSRTRGASPVPLIQEAESADSAWTEALSVELFIRRGHEGGGPWRRRRWGIFTGLLACLLTLRSGWATSDPSHAGPPPREG